MTKEGNHPYCCDEFAAQTNEFMDQPPNYSTGTLDQEDNNTWTLTNCEDCADLKGIRFCPFCGKPADQPGIERVYWQRHTPLFHQNGDPVRWRDLAEDGVYEVDENDNKISRADGISPYGTPDFRRKSDMRPLIIDGMQALHADGSPVVMEYIREVGLGQFYEFDPETRVITPIKQFTGKKESFFYRVGKLAISETPTADKDD